MCVCVCVALAQKITTLLALTKDKSLSLSRYGWGKIKAGRAESLLQLLSFSDNRSLLGGQKENLFYYYLLCVLGGIIGKYAYASAL